MNTNDILAALSGLDDHALFQEADSIRKNVFGNEVNIQAEIRFSNVCTGSCRHCRLQSANRRLKRYRMRSNQILTAAKHAVAQDAHTIILRSGNDTGFSTQLIGEIIREIKNRFKVSVTLALSDRSLHEYAYWKDCGADRCLIRLETTDVELHKRLRQGESLTERLRIIDRLNRMGFEVGSGVIAGLPGTTPMDALRDILFLNALELDMIEVRPFVPLADTPMAAMPPGSPDLSMRMTALLRIINPGAAIPAASALDILRPDSRIQALKKGCNVLIPSTPRTLDHDVQENHHPESLTWAKEAIASTGLEISRAPKGSQGKQHVG